MGRSEIARCVSEIAVKDMRRACRRYKHDISTLRYRSWLILLGRLVCHAQLAHSCINDALFTFFQAGGAVRGTTAESARRPVRIERYRSRSVHIAKSYKNRAWRIRFATLVALATCVGFAEPIVALDRVKFATNWLADPEAGGFFQAVADGTYAKHGLDVTVIPGGPQTNGALMLLFGKVDFFMGGDLIGDFMSAESKLPLVAVGPDFQKSPQILMSHPGVGLDKWTDLPKANAVYLGAGSINTFYAWLRLVYGFKDEAIRPYNFNSAPFIHNRTLSSRDMSPRSHTRSRNRAASGRTSSCSPITATRLIQPLSRLAETSLRATLTSCSASSMPPLSGGITILRRQLQGKRDDQSAEPRHQRRSDCLLN